MFTRLISLTLVAFLSITGGPGLLNARPAVRRVVVVSVDGLRPDALSAARTPTISRLWKRGAYSFRAQTIFPPKTVPAHASMLTGLTPKRHGMVKSKWKPGQATIAVDTVFTLAHAHGLKTAMVVAKLKLATTLTNTRRVASCSNIMAEKLNPVKLSSSRNSSGP